MAGKVKILSVLLLAVGCIQVGDERSRLDLLVGHAAVEDAEVHTSGGLGHVRSFEPGHLQVWSQAPTYDIELTPGTQQNWVIEIRNALSDSNLVRDDGQVFDCAPNGVPTRRVCEVELDGPATFRIVVDEDPSAPLTFALFADVQKAINTFPSFVKRMGQEPDVRFALMSGDLTDRGKSEQLDVFQKELEGLPFPVYATLGNHELGAGQDGFHRFFGRGNYSFVFADRRFTMIDSAGAAIGQEVRGWLDDWFQDGDDQFHVVAMHIPPLDPIGSRNAGFASRAEARDFVAQMAKHNVDLTLYGHVHSYHEYTNAGIPAIISGGGGAAGERLDGIDRHFVVFTVPAPGAEKSPKPFQHRVVRVD